MKRPIALGLFALTVLASGCVVGQSPAPRAGYPSQVVMVFDQPGTIRYLPAYNVYYVPDTPRDIFVVDDVWYHRADRLWYSGSSIDGPWTRIDLVQVPPPVVKLPPGYRDPATPHEDIPWEQWKKGRRRGPEPPPPRGDGRDGRQDRWDREEGRGPGEDRWERREDRTEMPGQPALVLPPGIERPAGAGPDRPPRRPEPFLPPMRSGRVSYLNRLVLSGVYYIPGIEQEVFLVGDAWYRRQDGGWYRASDYEGRWTLENSAAVPRALWSLSPRYREEPMERVRYPFGAPAQPVVGQPEPPRQAQPPTRVQPPAPARPEPARTPLVVPPPSPTPPEPRGHGREPQPPAALPAETATAKPARPDQPGPARERPAPRNSGRPGEEEHEKAMPSKKTTDQGPTDAVLEGTHRAAAEDRSSLPDEKARPSERHPRSESKPDRATGAQAGKADRLPKMDLPRPSTVRHIPARGLDYLPGVPEILRYQGGWYMRSEGSWYRSGDYAGPWSPLSDRELPQAIRILPPGYRSEPAEDVPFDDVERNLKGKGR